MSKFISFSLMKLQKDVVNGQPSDTLFTNIVNLVRNNFPGVTHLEVTVPINSEAEFKTYGNNPSPRTPEAFTDFLLDTIHNAGYNVIIRATDAHGEGIYNFPYVPNTALHWINQATTHLTAHKAHLKSGDVAAYFPEFEGQGNGFGANVTDSWSDFYKGLVNAVATWSTANGIDIKSFTTINESEASSGWYGQDILQVQKAFVVDYYPDANITDETQWIQNAQTTIDLLHNKYTPSYPVFLQEIADTRNPQNGSTQTANPQMLADFHTNVAVPYLNSGKLLGINYWNLFDTPQEGIIKIDGTSVSLNSKGVALAKAFQASVSPTPPNPTPTPPAFVIPAFSGTLVSDGKGNITFKQTTGAS